MILPPFLVAITNFIVNYIVTFPMAYTPIILTIIFILNKKFLYRFSKLLNTKVVAFFIVGLMCFCVRQIFVGITKQYWAWMIGYLIFALIILLYTKKNKGYDNITSFRLTVYSIWAASFLKESVWYMLYSKDWIDEIVEYAIFGTGDWWMFLGFHVSCIISTFFFFLILVQLGWRPSKKWIVLVIICFLVELFIFEPVWRVKVIHSHIANFHRVPWYVIMLLAIIKSPKGKKK